VYCIGNHATWPKIRGVQIAGDHGDYFCMAAQICGSSVWNLLHVTLLMSIILIWLVDLCKIRATLPTTPHTWTHCSGWQIVCEGVGQQSVKCYVSDEVRAPVWIRPQKNTYSTMRFSLYWLIFMEVRVLGFILMTPTEIQLRGCLHSRSLRFWISFRHELNFKNHFSFTNLQQYSLLNKQALITT
jgi:hypothetical protein